MGDDILLEELDLEQVRIYEELYDVPEITTDEAYDIAEGFHEQSFKD